MYKPIAATVSAALILMSVSPALAQDQRFSGFDAPRGLTATANLRVPLGREAKSRRASYGVTVGLGREVGAGFDGRPITRSVRLADLRFSGEGRLSQARLAGVDLASPDRDRRLNLMGGGGTAWFVLGAIAAAAGICLLTDCLGEGDDDAVPND
ncbi:MAG TPA: hypothetical protein VEA60_05625 [Allosphingosinicella sp.]|nr:hypothetical protein [Allosphingosinicella sp.]